MKYIIAVVMSLALIGCGGGGGSSSTSTNPTTPDDSVVVIPEEHCSVGNTYTEYLNTRVYEFNVNECNGLVSVDLVSKTGLIDTVTYSNSTSVTYSQGYNPLNPHSLDMGEIYSIKWDTEDKNQEIYQWDENLQCYNSNVGKILCAGDDQLELIKTYYEYSLVEYEFSQAIKEASRI